MRLRILAATKDFTVLDFSTLTNVCECDTSSVAKSLVRLIDLHIIEGSGDTYNLSPPLKIAVERDGRFKLDPVERAHMFAHN